MVTVTTKEELKQAIKKNEQHIVVEGKLATKIKKMKKCKKGLTIASGVLLAAGIALIPFTGGSSGVAVMGLEAAAGTVSLSTVEVLAIVGVIGLTFSIALFKNYDIIMSKGDTKIEFIHK